MSDIDVLFAHLRAHPCFDRCVSIYANALTDWAGSESIREAAETIGMNRRAYCDSRLAANQFQWTAPGTGDDFTGRHQELAYMDANERVKPTDPESF